MKSDRNVILIGYMGSGKTTVGRLLADKLEYQFIDTDKYIEKNTGLSIPQIFEQFGEDHFRALEKEVISSVKKEKKIVLSTGGGMPCHSSNMEVLNSIGTSFYLSVPAYVLTNRLWPDRSIRPIIADIENKHSLYAFVDNHLNQRIKCYESADVIIDGSSTPEAIVEDLKQVMAGLG